MKLVDDILSQAAAHPGRTALELGGGSLTYGELVSLARGEAARLAAAEPGAKGPVAVTAGGNLPAPALFLACLLAGRPYLPLGDDLPAPRREAILRDAAGGPGDQGLAYLMYTSGSSGRPKGVEITRGNLDFFLGTTRDLPREPEGEAVWLTHAPWSFDLSVLPLWQGLARGDRVVRLDTSRGVDFPSLAARMAGSGATIWVSTPSFARLWLSDPGFGAALLPRLTAFCFCGEVLEPALALALMDRFPGARVYNSYGPTETTVAAALLGIPREMAGAGNPLPVGRALPGVSLAIGGRNGACLPDGREGEILIGGPGVGRGYRNLPGLTGKQFFQRDGLPWYRTGDRGMLLDGMLYFLGRRDLQVKHRGCRVELQDLERNLTALPGVGGAAAALIGGRLLALVSPQAGAGPSPGELLAALRQRLPHYLLPSRIFVVPALPLTPRGKADRAAAAELLERLQKGMN